MSTQTSPSSAPAGTNPGTEPTSPLTFGGISAPTTSAPASTSQSIITPNMASASQYLMQEIGGDSVNLGFGLPNGGQMTINQALTWFLSLDPQQLYQIESQMYAAGLYVAGNNGMPLETPPVFGSKDPQSTSAFIQLLAAAYDQQTPASSVLAGYEAQGLGVLNRATLPSAVQGGGNVYQIDLTNPADVNYAATSIFQAALGRNPTQAEVASITDTVNSGALAQGYQQEAAQEKQSEAKYSASITQRNTAYEYQTTPKVSTGAIPNGPITNPEQWAVSLLQANGSPTTASNIQFLTGWYEKAGGSLAGFNPIGALYQAPGSTPHPGNGPPSYPSWAAGIQATIQSLNSGSYQNILSALQSGDAMSQVTNPAVAAELAKWSNNSYSSVPAGNANQAQAASAAASRITTTATPATIGEQQGMAKANQMNLGAGTPTAMTAGPNLGATATPVPASATATPPADVNPGQQVTNPGDIYVSPETVVTTNPASPSAAAYQEATTGANRPAFLGNEYLNAYNAILSMIKAGGPTAS